MIKPYISPTITGPEFKAWRLSCHVGFLELHRHTRVAERTIENFEKNRAKTKIDVIERLITGVNALKREAPVNLRVPRSAHQTANELMREVEDLRSRVTTLETELSVLKGFTHKRLANTPLLPIGAQ